MKKKKQKKSSAAKTAVTTVAGIFAAGAVIGGLFGEAPEETVDPSADTAYSETLEELPPLRTLELLEPDTVPVPEELPEPEIPSVDYGSIDVSVQSEKAMADDLKALGLFKGASDTDYALDRAPTRTEAVVMLLRILGKENEVLTAGYSHPFTDVPEWADPYIGYAYTTGLSQGVSETEFGSGNASAAMYLTLVLRSLGYSDTNGEDFTWDNPYTLSEELGILQERVDTENFLRGDVVTVSHAALSAKFKNTEETLSEHLIADEIFTQETFNDIYYSIEEIYVPEAEVIETLVLPEPTVESEAEIPDKSTPEPIPEPVPEPEPAPEPVSEPEPVIETPPAEEIPIYVEPEPTWNTETESETGQTLRLEWVSSPVGRNETATLVAIGKPNTEYSISVYYSSGASTAKGLEPQQSDSSGNVSWSWKVGAKTKAGSHRIVISGGGEKIETTFTTTE